MVETTMRAYRAGEPAVFLAAVAPYIKAMWAPYTGNMTTSYDELTDFDRVRPQRGGGGAPCSHRFFRCRGLKLRGFARPP
jgi:hypothetical protein